MSCSFIIKSSVFVTFVAILTSFYINSPYIISLINKEVNNRQSSVLNGLLELEAKNFVASGPLQPRVAVGYGACHDVFVEAKDLLKDSVLSGAPEHFDEIKNDIQLLKSFAYYYKHGAAAE